MNLLRIGLRDILREEPNEGGGGGGGGGTPTNPAAGGLANAAPASQASDPDSPSDDPAVQGGTPSDEGGDAFAQWRDTLSASDRRTIEEKGLTGFDGLLRSYKNAVKHIRGDGLPKPPDSDEGRQQWFQESGIKDALGIPDKGEGYQVDAPAFPDDVKDVINVDDADMAAFRDRAAEVHMTPRQLAAMQDLYVENMAKNARAGLEGITTDQNEFDALKGADQWGTHFAENLSVALETASEYGLDQGSIEALRAGNVMGSQALAKMLYDLGTTRGNDSLSGGGTTPSARTAEGRAAEYEQYKAANAKVLNDPNHPEHDTTMERYRGLRRAAGIGSSAPHG